MQEGSLHKAHRTAVSGAPAVRKQKNTQNKKENKTSGCKLSRRYGPCTRERPQEIKDKKKKNSLLIGFSAAPSTPSSGPQQFRPIDTYMDNGRGNKPEAVEKRTSLHSFQHRLLFSSVARQQIFTAITPTAGAGIALWSSARALERRSEREYGGSVDKAFEETVRIEPDWFREA